MTRNHVTKSMHYSALNISEMVQDRDSYNGIGPYLLIGYYTRAAEFRMTSNN